MAPIPVPNGWWPRVWVSPEGRILVAHGNAECYLTEFTRSGTVLTHVSTAIIGPPGAWGGYWIAPYTLTFWRERPDVGHDFWERYTYDVRTGTPVVVQPPGPAVGGNVMDARDGHAVAWMASTLRVMLDGALLATNAGPASVAESWVAWMTPDHARISRMSPSFDTVEYPTATPMHQMAIGPNGIVAYGGYGPVHTLIGPVDADATLALSRTEGAPWLWRNSDGIVWLATVAYDGAAFCLLRPVGSHEAIIVHVGAVFLTVANDGDCFILATCGDRGEGVVTAIPRDTPLQPVGPQYRFDRVVGMIDYCEKNKPTHGNGTIPVRPSAPVSGPACIGPESKPFVSSVWSYHAGEGDGVTCEQAIDRMRPIADAAGFYLDVYQDNAGPLRPSVLQRIQKGDVASCNVYRNQAESAEAYNRRVRETYSFEADRHVRFWPTVGISRRGTWLSDAEVVEGFDICMRAAIDQGWEGFFVFMEGRDDVPPQMYDRLAYAKSSITGMPAPLTKVIPPPTTFQECRRMTATKGYVKTLDNKYIGCEPGTTTVYRDRPAGGVWEEIDFLPSKGTSGKWNCILKAAQLVLAQTPDGKLETRPLGTDGAFEQFEIGKMPPEFGVIPAFVRYKIGDFGATREVPEVLFAEERK